jgi:hypothetical protein
MSGKPNTNITTPSTVPIARTKTSSEEQPAARRARAHAERHRSNGPSQQLLCRKHATASTAVRRVRKAVEEPIIPKLGEESKTGSVYAVPDAQQKTKGLAWQQVAYEIGRTSFPRTCVRASLGFDRPGGLSYHAPHLEIPKSPGASMARLDRLPIGPQVANLPHVRPMADGFRMNRTIAADSRR